MYTRNGQRFWKTFAARPSNHDPPDFDLNVILRFNGIPIFPFIFFWYNNAWPQVTVEGQEPATTRRYHGRITQLRSPSNLSQALDSTIQLLPLATLDDYRVSHTPQLSFTNRRYCQILTTWFNRMQRFSRNIQQTQLRSISTTLVRQVMKPGTPITGLQLKVGQEQIVVLKQSEYPDWINTLATPKISLAKLRQMELTDDTSDADMKRYLRLTRRAQIKAYNLESMPN